MATISDILEAPLSGATHIDALLNQDGLNWSYVTDIPFNTIRYSFALDGAELTSDEIVSGTATTFSATQQAATRSALAYLSTLTGVQFLETTASLADVQFANASIVTNQVAGLFAWNVDYWTDSTDTVTRYEVDSVVYLDSVEFGGYNATLNVGSGGYETLLHELGHMLGLKHPFEGDIQLPGSLDNTANTLMSYESAGGPYSTYGDLDVAALAWLYGGDGIGGAYGTDAQGRILIGSDVAEELVGTGGWDILAGLGGNDTFDGGGGVDHVVYGSARGDYQISRNGGIVTINGVDGNDQLQNIERIAFDDADVALDINGAGGSAYRLYQAAFDRAPDLVGLGFWMAILDNAGSLRDVANDFLKSPEFAERYGSNPDNATFVTNLYHNVLHREPEQAGYNWWLDVVNAGADRASVLVGFSESAENAATVNATIGNGFEYIPWG